MMVYVNWDPLSARKPPAISKNVNLLTIRVHNSSSLELFFHVSRQLMSYFIYLFISGRSRGLMKKPPLLQSLGTIALVVIVSYVVCEIISMQINLIARCFLFNIQGDHSFIFAKQNTIASEKFAQIFQRFWPVVFILHQYHSETLNMITLYI